jgi:uncharacterized protein
MRRQRYLTGLAAAIGRRPWAFLIAGIVLAVVAGVYTWRSLEFKTSRNDLIGRDSEYWRLYSEFAREFRSEEDYIVVVESDRPERNKLAVDALTQTLLAPANNPSAQDEPAAQTFQPDDVFYRVDFEALKPWFLYYLSVDDLTQIRDSVKDFKQLVAVLQQNPRLDTFFDSMNQMLQQMETAPAAQRRQMEAFLPTISAIVRQMATFDGVKPGDALLSPWASAFFSEEMLGEAEQQMRWQGYQTFRNGKMFIVLVHPRGPGEGGANAPHDATIPKLHRIIRKVRQQFPDLKINLTGESVLDYDEMLWSQRDATKATLVTLVLIGVIFAVGFRELLRPVLAVISIIIVVAVSMGWATLAIGHLNIITVTFAVMILGLGIDLGIQLIARFEEELNKGADRPQAVAVAIEQTGTSIITAGVTNAAAFFAMGLSGFKGVMELGVIAGGGMIIATAATMLILPALLLVVHRQRESTAIPVQVVATRIERLLLRRPWLTLVICGMVTAGALLVGWRIHFDYNVLNLQTKNLASVETELRLLKADAESTIYGAIVCDTFAQTRELQHSLTGLPTVATVHSIAELIPEDQAQKTPLIRSIQETIGEVNFPAVPADPAAGESVLRSLGSLRLRASQLAAEPGSGKELAALTNALTQARATLQGVEPAQLTPRLATYERRFYDDLEAQMKLMTGQVTDRPMTIADVPVNVRRMLIGKTGKFLVRVFPKQNIWEREPLENFVRDVQSVAPKVTGTPLGLYEFVGILQQGYIKAAFWAFLVITILILIDLRGWFATLLTLLPLMVGMIWMVGTLAICNIAFNPANIMVLPLMVGIGVAYGIYVVQRYRQDGEAAFYGKSTGRAVILSGLTTVAAFGSLLIGSHQGIRSLGLVMTIGVVACLVASLVLLPSLLEVARRRQWKV